MKIICCVFAVFLFVFASVFADFLTDASLPFTRIDPGIVIEKYPIATPVKNGPLKILFFGSRDTVGQAVSGIAARLECRFEAVLTESRTQIGARPYMSTDEADILSENAILERAVTLLRERWDVIWLDFGLDDLPERVRLAMLNNVDRGAGLVCVGNSRQLKKYASGRKGDTRQLEAAVFAKFKPVCAGKRGIGLLVAMPQPYLRGSARDVADYHTSAVNAVMVASGKNTGIVVTKVPKPARIYPLDGLTGKYYRVYLYNNGDKRDIKFHMRYRNDSGHLTAELMNSYIVEHGRSYVKITFPYVPIGVYSVDISLFDSGGVTAIAGTSFAVTSRMFISEIDCWERIAREGGDINGVVRLSQGLQKGMKLELELVDGWGRLIGQQVFSSDNDLNNDGLEFTLRHHKERSLTARARLYRDGELVHELEKPVFTMKEFDARKYSLIVTDDLASEVSSRERYKVLGRAGVTGIDIDLTGIDSTRNAVRIAQNAAGSGLRIIPRIARIENTENKPVMNPVITTVDFNEKLDKRVRAFADTLKHLSPFAFSIGGTNMLTPYEVDVGFSTNDVESFQRYLESKYKSIDTLNHAWRTNYTSFREAQPVTFDDARLTDNYPAWLDTRLHMEAVFTLVHNVATESVYHVKSDAKVGIESFDDVWSPFRGFNLYELTGIVSLAVTPQDEGYGLPGDCSVSAAVASFAIPGSITGLSVNGDASSRGSEELLRSAPWESLFLRMNSVWWKKTYGGVDAALTPQNTLSPAFSAVAEEAREIMGGIDILLGGSTLHTDHIGILYSPVSKFAAWTSADPETHPSAASVSQHGFDNIHMMSSSVRSFYLAFREAGYNPVFVAEDQVTDSWLIEQNIKVLVLPFIQAMSDETADYIKKFVKRGGTVIADLRPGVMDDHLVMRDTGVLDTVFDITQGTERKTPTVSGTFVSQKIRGKIPAQITFDNCRSDPTVKTGKDVFVFASVGNTPAVIFNRYGSGCGIFLNMDMGRYELMNSGRQRAAYRDVISWCLSSGGLYTPVISVRDSKGVMENGMNISVFKDFDAIYIGLLRNPALMETGDSVSGYFLDLTRIKSPGFIYNVRTREYLGTGSKIPVNVQTGKAELFAFMPYRLVGLDMKINNPVVVVGNTVDFSVTIITGRNNTKPCRHALRVEAVAPDGSLKPFLASTIEAVFGDAKSTIYISPDDPPGRWVLRVTDIVTGRQAERSFMVMATGSTNQ